MVLEKHLEGTRSTRKGDPHTKITPSSPEVMVQEEKERLGALSGEHTVGENWSLPESIWNIKFLKLKAVFLKEIK